MPRPTEQILTMLADAPVRLAEITRDLPPDRLIAPPEPGEWSTRDVLGHLRACSDMWGGCMVRILNEDRPTIKAVNPGTWIKQTNYLELEFQPSLRAYTDQRAGLLAVLKPLSPEEWARGATVTVAGRPLERTVYSYALWLADHERTHVKQIERTVSPAGVRRRA